MLSELAFSGRHAEQCVWVLTQKYNSVLKDLRKQIRWLALFYCKDRDSFVDVIPLEKQNEIRQQLTKTKYTKLLLKNDQPADYKMIN